MAFTGQRGVRMTSREVVEEYGRGRREFTYVEVVKADFTGAALGGADFRGAFLNSVKVEGAHFSGASFDGARLSRANLSNTDLGALCGATNLRHDNPCSIDAHAVMKSYGHPELYKFMLRCGVPAFFAESMIDCARTLGE
ncbi:pentapeptide repeat-containing protein [Streptomyces sp. NPDC059496]|uniref:pentapeptide repeat-containing protein n=1 Tax=Streptomyces sp. NPDC059496 TaxID=3346851 RepID=UPI0036D0D5AA